MRPPRQPRPKKQSRDLGEGGGFSFAPSAPLQAPPPQMQPRPQFRSRTRPSGGEFFTSGRGPRMPSQETMRDEGGVRRMGRERTSAINVKEEGGEILSKPEMMEHFGQFGNIVDLEMGPGNRSAVVTFEQPVPFSHNFNFL